MTIKQRQCLLFYLGYYVGDIDGIWGSMSKTAVRSFQGDYGLHVTGVVDTDTEKALTHAVTYGMPAKNVEPEVTPENVWDKIEHFKRSEFACKCGGKYCNGYPAEMEPELLFIADDVREHFGAAVIVSSGLRCEQHNANVGGVANSRHRFGKAMDFRVVGKTSTEVLEYVQSKPKVRYAYAIDGTYVHMDVL